MAKLSSPAVDGFLAKRIGLAQRMQFSYDPGDLVRVGNRWVPRMIRVELPGGGPTPFTELRIEVRHGIPVCTELRLSTHPAGRVFGMRWVDTRFRFAGVRAYARESEAIGVTIGVRNVFAGTKRLPANTPLPTVHHMDINTSDRFIAAEFAGPLVVPGVTRCLGNY